MNKSILPENKVIRYLILLIGMAAAAFFIWSVYTFVASRGYFRIASLGFLLSAMLFFILIIIRKIWDDRAYRKKTRLR